MEREIVLSSYDSDGSKNPANFVTRFHNPIKLDSNQKYVIGLNRIINMSFTWTNINPEYKNQLIRYSEDNGVSFTDLTFEKGIWTYTSIEEYLREKTVIKSSGKDDEFPIKLEFDAKTLRVEITLKSNYQLDLTKSNFHEIIGYDKNIVKDAFNTGTKMPNMAQDTESLNIHCDLINESLVDGKESDIIYSFSTSVLKPSYSFTIEPMRVTYNPVNKSTIGSIRIYITDGKKRIIDLNQADTGFLLF